MQQDYAAEQILVSAAGKTRLRAAAAAPKDGTMQPPKIIREATFNPKVCQYWLIGDAIAERETEAPVRDLPDRDVLLTEIRDSLLRIETALRDTPDGSPAAPARD
jgi:hypothetical protein